MPSDAQASGDVEQSQGEDDFEDILQNCVVAFDFTNKKLGLSYYKADERQLFLASDISEDAPYECWKAALNQINPDLILLSARANDILQEQTEFQSILQHAEVRPRNEFSAKKCLDKLVLFFMNRDHDFQDVIRFGPEQGTEESRRHYAEIKLKGTIDVMAELSLGCVNVMMCFIDRKRNVSNVRGIEYLSLMVQSVEMFRLERAVILNADTMSALRIFPSNEGVKEKGKEDPTLFGIMNLCRTPPGKTLLRHWFMAPTTDLRTIKSRHDAIECLSTPYNSHYSNQISKDIARCANMHKAVQDLRMGHQMSSTGGIWQTVLNFVFHAIKVLESVESMQGITEVASLNYLCNTFDVDVLRKIGALINDVIDFDESEAEERVVVKRLVDEELDTHKDVYDSLEEVLDKVCSELAGRIPRQYEDVVQCIYLPQLGFLTVMPAQENDAASAADHMVPVWQSEEWTIHFSTANSVYFKSEHMRELDDYFGDIHSLVVDREIELLHQLQVRILEHGDLLIRCSDILAELDCLLAFANAARKYKWTKPEMTEENVLLIKGGRHPLYELTSNVFVPNDVSIAGRDVGEATEESARELDDVDSAFVPNLILMTGANQSGKSVYLKQTAIIVYMAHLGSFVPATHAVIGITDRILTRLMCRESVTKAESAFMIDLQQVAIALQLMTPRSLLVIDEFGKGTETLDGAALFGALVEHLTDATHMRPRSLVTTHFHEVLRPGFLRTSRAMTLAHMEIIIDKGAEQISDQITHLYRVANGPSLSSFGINCAAVGGVPDHILARAEQLLEVSAAGDCLIDALSVLTEEEKVELELAEAMARRFAAWDIDAEPDETLRTKLSEIIKG